MAWHPRKLLASASIAPQGVGLLRPAAAQGDLLPAAWVGRGLGVAEGAGVGIHTRVLTLALPRRPGVHCPWPWFLKL